MNAMDEFEQRWAARDLREAILNMALRYAQSTAELATGERRAWSTLRGRADTDAARHRAVLRRQLALFRLTNALAKMAGA